MKRSMLAVPVRKVDESSSARPEEQQDLLAVEEPLQIRLAGRDISITMRTPGYDEELAAGFLFTEGIVRASSDIAHIECGDNLVFRRNIHLSCAHVCAKAFQFRLGLGILFG